MTLKNRRVPNLSKFQKFTFWYSVIITFGLIFVMAYIDGVKPFELINYVRDK